MATEPESEPDRAPESAPEKEQKLFRISMPLALTLGGMIMLGITTTTLGFLLWPEPDAHLDTSTEGWPGASPAFSKEVRSAPSSGRSGVPSLRSVLSPGLLDGDVAPDAQSSPAVESTKSVRSPTRRIDTGDVDSSDDDARDGGARDDARDAASTGTGAGAGAGSRSRHSASQHVSAETAKPLPPPSSTLLPAHRAVR